MTSNSKRYDRIIVKDLRGKTMAKFIRSFGGDLRMTIEGGRTVIEQKGFLGWTKIYLPPIDAFIEAIV